MLDPINIFSTAAISILQSLVKNAIDELNAQGHKLTGALEKSFEIKVTQTAEGIVGSILQNDYAIDLDTGVKASDIPSLRSAAGKKYVNDLIDYFKKRGYSLSQAKSYGVATAKKASRIGHPTQPYYNNRVYSKNGRRTGWIEASYSEENINKALDKVDFGKHVQEILDDLVNEVNLVS